MPSLFRRAAVLSLWLVLLVTCVPSSLHAQYGVTNLVSNNGNAQFTDPQLVNPWGIAFGPPGGGLPGSPFWIEDEGSGWSTPHFAYGAQGSPRLTIPPAMGSGSGSPTGVVHNGTQDFFYRGDYSLFMIATLDGTICDWVPLLDFNSVLVMVNNSGSHTSYTGLAISQHLQPTPNFLFAADHANKKIDVFDTNFTFVRSFGDSGLGNMAPFGIQDINGQLYVTFVSSSVGPISAIVDVFNEDGTLVRRFTDSHLNHPWGMAVAPGNFGPLSNALLISNNTSAGTINAFNLNTGAYVGTVKDTSGHPIVVDGLWGITFGGGSRSNGQTNQLFFNAGPNHGADGLFGMIEFE